MTNLKLSDTQEYALNKIHNDEMEEMTKKKIGNIYGVDKNSVFLTNTGRTALYLILRALNLKKGAKIGVQLFSCPVVFEAIIQAGYKPVFLEIDPKTFTLDITQLKLIGKKLDALIVIHTFGNPADMDSLRNIMKDKPIIEDCAHGIYSKYKNKFVGTIGDASFFSYGPGKNLSAGGGGALIINNSNKFKISIDDLIKYLKEPTLKDEFKFILFNYTKSLFYKKPWYGMFAFDLAKKFDSQLDFQDKTSFNIKKIYNPNIAIICRRLNSFEKRITLQQKNIEILEKVIKKIKIKTIKPTPNSKPLYYLYPIVFSDSQKRNNMYNRLKMHGIDSLKFYSDTPRIARKLYGYNGECKSTENTLNKLLVLPTYYCINSNITNKIIK